LTDKELLIFVAEFRAGLLGGASARGMCAVVCWPLVSLLAAVGVEAELEDLDWSDAPRGLLNHVIIRLADGRVLDPTADQFGLASVYLGPMPEIYSDHARRLRSVD